MHTGSIGSPMIVTPFALPAGRYEAMWSGYQIEVPWPNATVVLRTEAGVRGLVSGVLVVGDDGAAVFLTK